MVRMLGKPLERPMNLLFTIVFLLAFAASSFGDIIPASRRINWDPGVRGGLLVTNRSVWTNMIAIDGTGAIDVSGALQYALSRCPSNQVVLLPSGTFKIASKIYVPSGVTLRGLGMSNTTISGASGFPGDSLVTVGSSAYDYAFSHFPTINISGDLLKGATNVTTSTPHGWSTGDYILIDRLPDNTNTVSTYNGADPPVYDQLPGYTLITWGGRNAAGVNQNRICAQWVHVLSVPSSTTATFEPPLYMNYSNVYSPQAVKAYGISFYSGLEHLTIDNSLSGAYHGCSQLSGAVNSWIYDVQFLNVSGPEDFVQVRGGLWCTLKHSTFRLNGSVSGNSQAYGVYSVQPHSAFLFEDNIFNRCELAFGIEGGVGGDVYSYNYVTNLIYADSPPGSTQRQFGIAHGGFNHMQLIEGNFIEDGGIDADNYQGNHAFLTIFRNRFQTRTNAMYGNVAIENWGKNWYFNIVGNVLGHSNFETRYQVLPLQNYSSQMNTLQNPPSIYHFGYRAAAVNGSAVANYAYPEINTNTLRHGNWDSSTITNQGIVWDPTISDHAIPPSYYLLNKPSWFGNLTWPPIDPTNPSVSASVIPAGYRFLHGFDPPAVAGNQPPVALGSASPLSGPAPLTSAFSSAGSYDPEGASLTYNWTFGDGTTSTVANPVHTYQAAGSYSAQLQVSDGTNTALSGVLTLTANVATNQPPVAVVGATSTAGLAPLAVTFSSAGSYDPEGATLTFSWSFGDGATSTAPNPAHTYQTPGSYSAQLQVSDGTSTTKSSVLVISAQSRGPVAAYGFEEGSGTNVDDASGNGNNGIIAGAQWIAGKFGNALSFNGTNAIVIVNDSAALDLTTGMTLEAWVFPTALNGFTDIIYKDSNAYWLVGSTPTVQAPGGGGSFATAMVSGSSPLPMNTWSHIAETYDGTNILLYVNGVHVGSLAQSGPINVSTGALMLGGNALVSGKNFAGLIDEVRIYNRALSSAEIQTDMASPVVSRPPPPSGLRVVGP